MSAGRVSSCVSADAVCLYVLCICVCLTTTTGQPTSTFTIALQVPFGPRVSVSVIISGANSDTVLQAILNNATAIKCAHSTFVYNVALSVSHAGTGPPREPFPLRLQAIIHPLRLVRRPIHN